MPTAELISCTSDYMELLKCGAGQCYQNDASETIINNIIKAGHLSVLEHCPASFKVTCSMSVLLQLTRHRHFSLTVQSSRGSELTSFNKTGIDAIDKCNADTMTIYNSLLKKGSYKKEDVSYILPKAAEYNLVITGNFRAWFEYLPKRLCKRALPEHRKLAELIHAELALYAPFVFDRDMLHCSDCRERSCSFC